MKRKKKPSTWNPANLLTLLRIVLVPVFASLMLYHQDAWALAVYIFAALTDLVDGWLARRYGWVTKLGVFIDPMADKLLQLTAITLLSLQGHAPIWAAVLAWARELIVVSGFVLLAMTGVSRTLRSSWFGKAGTMAQMSVLALAMALPLAPWVGWALAAAIVFNFVSGLEYALKGFQAYDKAARA